MSWSLTRGRMLAMSALVLLTLIGCGSGSGAISDATLSALDCASGALTPAFDPATTMYTMDVGLLVPTTTATPTATDPAATITVNGAPVTSGDISQAIALAPGPTPVMIVVTAANGVTQQTYTVVITRAATAMQEGGYLKASNAEPDDQFGTSVAISGDTLVVGGPFEDSSAAGGEADNSTSDAGAVYVFTRTGSVWSLQQFLKASNAGMDDQFGTSVAISGDTLVVGALGEDSSAAGGEADNSTPFSGAAYVFTRTGSVWSQQQVLKASNAGQFDGFGFSVAISGNTLLVGARNEDSSAAGGEADNSAESAGAAYVFTRAGSVWSQQQVLKASNAEAGDRFGTSVAISGDTLVVGAHEEDSSATGGEADNSARNAGAAYVFTRAGSVWSQQQVLKASNAEASDGFGFSVAISGDTLVVGAASEDSSMAGGEADNSESGAGAAYVFTRTGSVWSQQQLLKASNAEVGDQFGFSVAISGDTLVVGASEESSSAAGGEADNSASSAGAAYAFTRTGFVWSQQQYLKASNAEAIDRFGFSVAISGDTLGVGAAFEDSSAAGGEADNSAAGAGTAYVIR